MHTQRAAFYVPLPFPHPAVPFEEHKEHLSRFYHEMAQGVSNFIEKLAVWEKANDKAAASIRKAIDTLPDASLKHLEAQYVELARKYPDYVWSHLYEHRSTRAKLKNMSRDLNDYFAQSGKAIDVGLGNLQKAVAAIRGEFRAVEASDVVEGLKRHYQARIDDPIVEDEYKPEDDKVSLKFPKISEAFVPQAYRVLRQTAKNYHLEREQTWAPIGIRNDLGPSDRPLVILLDGYDELLIEVLYISSSLSLNETTEKTVGSIHPEATDSAGNIQGEAMRGPVSSVGRHFP